MNERILERIKLQKFNNKSENISVHWIFENSEKLHSAVLQSEECYLE